MVKDAISEQLCAQARFIVSKLPQARMKVDGCLGKF